MPISDIKTLSKSSLTSNFNQLIIRKSDLHKQNFKEWLFWPGMLYNSEDKWWGDFGTRGTPHEGLDLCLYKNHHGKVLCLDDTVLISALYDGEIVGLANDFLGKTIIMEHRILNSRGRRLCVIYAHLIPVKEIHIGRKIKNGDVIATIADTNRTTSGILPHLHISVGWSSRGMAYDRFDWKTIMKQNTLSLRDPLDLIDVPYHVGKQPSSFKKLGSEIHF